MSPINDYITTAQPTIASSTGFDLVTLAHTMAAPDVQIILGELVNTVYADRWWLAAALIIGGIIGIAARGLNLIRV